MYSKEYYIKEIQEYVIHFNEYWEDPITESELVKNTEDTISAISGYCQLINTQMNLKKNRGLCEYDKLPGVVQSAIKSIIDLVNDGRDLWHEIEYSKVNSGQSRKFDHYVEKNGHLSFENNPLLRTFDIIELCNTLSELIQSEKSTADLKKYEGKYFTGEYYECGAYTIRIDKIYKNKKGKYTFDGYIIWWTTIDSRFEHDGILFEKVEDYPFEDLLFVEYDDDEEGNTFKNYIESLKEETKKSIEEQIKHRINYYLEEL